MSLCPLLVVALAGCSAGVVSMAGQPVVTIVADAASVRTGSAVSFTLTAEPAPAQPLPVNLAWSEMGSVTKPRPATVTIPPSGTATLRVDTGNGGIGERGSVTVTVSAGSGYTPGNSRAATVVLSDNGGDPPPPATTPVVTIVADAASVQEGSAVSFTLTAEPAPAESLSVDVAWSETGAFLLTGTRPATVTIPASGTATLRVDTENDATDEQDGSVAVTVSAGTDYTPGNPATATVSVTDDDPAVVTVVADDASVRSGEAVSFTVTAGVAPAQPLSVDLEWSETDFLMIDPVPATVTIPASGTATLRVNTADDRTGSVTVVVWPGTGYTPGSPDTATVIVSEDDEVKRKLVSIESMTPDPVRHGQEVTIRVTFDPETTGPVTYSLSINIHELRYHGYPLTALYFRPMDYITRTVAAGVTKSDVTWKLPEVDATNILNRVLKTSISSVEGEGYFYAADTHTVTVDLDDLD